MVDLQTIGQVMHPCTPLVGMGNDDDFVASIDQFRRQLVHVTFNAPWLGKEEVTDHSNVVGHVGILQAACGGLGLLARAMSD